MDELTSASERRQKQMNTFLSHFGLASTIFGLTSSTVVAVTKLPLLDVWGRSTFFTLVAYVLVLCYFAVRHRERTYQFDFTDEGGKALNHHIGKAQKCIACTCFTAEPPDPVYLAILENTLKRNIPTQRLVCFHGDLKQYDWLDKFERQPYYEQIVVKSGLPFNAVIIDDKIVWIFFSINQEPFFRHAMWFNDPGVARALKAMLDRWRKEQEIPGHERNVRLVRPAIANS